MKRLPKLTKLERGYVKRHLDDCSFRKKCTTCRGILKLLSFYDATRLEDAREKGQSK